MKTATGQIIVVMLKINHQISTHLSSYLNNQISISHQGSTFLSHKISSFLNHQGSQSLSHKISPHINQHQQKKRQLEIDSRSRNSSQTDWINKINLKRSNSIERSGEVSPSESSRVCLSC